MVRRNAEQSADREAASGVLLRVAVTARLQLLALQTRARSSRMAEPKARVANDRATAANFILTLTEAT